jgi:hypothetical protein
MITRKSKLAFILGVALVAFLAIGAFRVFAAPSCPAGTTCGAIAVDSYFNVSVGTTTGPNGAARFVLVASSTGAPYALKVFGLSGTPIFTIDNAGNASTTGSFAANSFTGNLVGSSIGAAYVAGGDVFGRLTGSPSSPFAFANNVGVNTSTQVGLPQPLSVYGNGYISGSLGIGTASPNNPLAIKGGGTGVVEIGQLSGATTYGAIAFTPGGTITTSNYSFGGDGNGTIINAPSGDVITFRIGNTVQAVVDSTGKLGVGTVSPNYKLDVGGQANATGYCIGGANCISVWPAGGTTSGWSTSGTNVYLATSTNSVGIGTATAYNKLQITGGGLIINGSNETITGSTSVTSPGTNVGMLQMGYDTTNNKAVLRSVLFGSSFEPLYFQGNEFRWATGAGGITEKMVLDVNGNLGIGVTGPTYKLDVVSGGGTTARFGTGSGDTVVIGGGAGKITVGTVDPVYTINGNKFSTYGAEMTGVKGETTGAVDFSGVNFTAGKTYSYTLALSGAEQGSDLWLFKETTQIVKNNMNGLVVMLTPSFDGEAWYVKDATKGTITVFAKPSLSTPSLEVSYRLTAPRFDASHWSNIGSGANDAGAPAGIIIND